MTKHQLSRALKRYEINSSTVRLGAGSTPKGYYRKQLEDAFARYVQPQLATSPQPAETLTKSPFSTRHTEAPKIQLATPKAAESVTCGDVASLNPDMSVCVRVPDPEADRVDAEERDAIREIDGEEDRSALLDIPDFLRREAAR